MNELIRRVIAKVSRSQHDPINEDPTPSQLGITEQHFDKEEDFRLVMPRGRYGFRTTYPNGQQIWTVKF